MSNQRCTCGSGAHPRRCEKHPWAMRVHAARLNCGLPNDWSDMGPSDYAEHEKALDELEAAVEFAVTARAVAWLRGRMGVGDGPVLIGPLADAIEAGAHLDNSKGGG